jgi:hypothetical protein
MDLSAPARASARRRGDRRVDRTDGRGSWLTWASRR